MKYTELMQSIKTTRKNSVHLIFTQIHKLHTTDQDYYVIHKDMGFPGGSVVKNLPVNAGDTNSIPESGRSPGE